MKALGKMNARLEMRRGEGRERVGEQTTQTQAHQYHKTRGIHEHLNTVHTLGIQDEN